MEISSIYLASVPVIIGLVQVLKGALKLPSRFVPLIAIVAGVGIAFGLGDFSFDSGLQGVVLGLTASGLYSGGKSTLGF